MAVAIPEQTRYSISEAARLLDRSPQTLRSWDRNQSMPEELRPYYAGWIDLEPRLYH